ncbi:hypothetical protein, partial [Romboutsia sp.]|uniref:hypothetical protein n=1 Tax=Romboutsia sp. TaxID=1965302 RepID=UPI003F2EA8AA
YDGYLEELDSSKYWTIEALVVGLADEIAQRHHDIEDAIEFNILSVESLIKEIEERFDNVFKDEDKALLEEIKANKDNKHLSIVLFSKLIVNFLTSDLIKNTEANLEQFITENNIEEGTLFTEVKQEKYSAQFVKELVSFSKEVEEVDDKLQDFLKNRILNSYIAQKMDGSGQYVIRKLFEAYVHNPQQLPDKTIKKLYTMLCKEIVKNDNLDLDYKYTISEKTKSILDYENFEKNKFDVGSIRDKISKMHYQLDDADEEKYSLYNDTLLRVICDFISGMTDKYALEQHKQLYNCGDLI